MMNLCCSLLSLARRLTNPRRSLLTHRNLTPSLPDCITDQVKSANAASGPRLGLASWKVSILVFLHRLSKAKPSPLPRYRFTATLIIESGCQCPHRTINAYLEAFTGFDG